MYQVFENEMKMKKKKNMICHFRCSIDQEVTDTRISHRGSAVMNLTSIHEDTGSIPGLA